MLTEPLALSTQEEKRDLAGNLTVPAECANSLENGAPGIHHRLVSDGFP